MRGGDQVRDLCPQLPLRHDDDRGYDVRPGWEDPLTQLGIAHGLDALLCLGRHDLLAVLLGHRDPALPGLLDEADQLGLAARLEQVAHDQRCRDLLAVGQLVLARVPVRNVLQYEGHVGARVQVVPQHHARRVGVRVPERRRAPHEHLLPVRQARDDILCAGVVIEYGQTIKPDAFREREHPPPVVADVDHDHKIGALDTRGGLGRVPAATPITSTVAPRLR